MASRQAGNSASRPEDSPSFEQAMERLETIVHELESGELTLDESLARYEEGTRLSQRLSRALDEAEKRIERLSQEGEPPTTTPMELHLDKGSRATSGGEGELPF
jgi:exodeoxyribonuclease VII small subunit